MPHESSLAGKHPGHLAGLAFITRMWPNLSQSQAWKREMGWQMGPTSKARAMISFPPDA